MNYKVVLLGIGDLSAVCTAPLFCTEALQKLVELEPQYQDAGAKGMSGLRSKEVITYSGEK